MNDQFESKIIDLCIGKLRNSPAMTCVFRLDLNHFEHSAVVIVGIRPGLIRGSLDSARVFNQQNNKFWCILNQLHWKSCYRNPLNLLLNVYRN